MKSFRHYFLPKEVIVSKRLHTHSSPHPTLLLTVSISVQLLCEIVRGVTSLLPLDTAGLSESEESWLRSLLRPQQDPGGHLPSAIWQLVSHAGPLLSSANFNLALFNFSKLYF